jgi:stringent starvation protein B
LKMDNDFVNFNARFGGVSREISVPVDNVVAIYARENGQGMAFEVTKKPADDTTTVTPIADLPAVNPVDAPPAAPTLTSVPAPHNNTADDSSQSDSNDHPDPPKKGGRPTLTRIK